MAFSITRPTGGPIPVEEDSHHWHIVSLFICFIHQSIYNYKGHTSIPYIMKEAEINLNDFKNEIKQLK